MATVIFRDGKKVEPYGRPYIIAEVNTSHNGDVESAFRMITAAKTAGADCVKFQSWSEQSLYSTEWRLENRVATRMVRKLSLSPVHLKEAADFARSEGIAFSSTPYSREEADFLVDSCSPAFLKIASMDLVNYPFLRYVASLGVPVVLSSGMADISEIELAVNEFLGVGHEQLCLLHCVSIYPCVPGLLNLRNVTGLQRLFPTVPVGFSDHSLGVVASIGAVSLGAAIIEKHLTLDSSKIGMDNQMATEPDEFAELVRNCHLVGDALGAEERVVGDEEMGQRLRMRRSIVATRDLYAGAIVCADDLDVKRPETGLPPVVLPELVGKVLRCDVREGMLLKRTDLIE